MILRISLAGIVALQRQVGSGSRNAKLRCELHRTWTQNWLDVHVATFRIADLWRASGVSRADHRLSAGKGTAFRPYI